MNRTMLIVIFILLIFALIPLFGVEDTNLVNTHPFIYEGRLANSLAERSFNLQIGRTQDGYIQLNWTIDPDAGSYKIFRSDSLLNSGDINWKEIADVTTNYFTDTREASTGFYQVCSSSVYTEGGTFTNNETRSSISLSPIYIDRYEVTQASYFSLMGNNPSMYVSLTKPVHMVSWFNAIEYCNRRSISANLTPCYSYSNYGTNPSNWPSGWNTNTANHVNVTCDWVANGYRLLTEMEWMYAAKGGNLSPASGYDNWSGTNVEAELTSFAWYSANMVISGPKQVGTKLPNQLLLHDMSGNICEWVWDIYGNYPSENQTNPHGALSGEYRVWRGGDYGYSANVCKVSYRGYSRPINRIIYGIRVCRNYLN